jgi:hypothetical protein
MLSVLAGAVNITGIVPQLLTMLRARSSKGQSSVGWLLAATCSGSLLFVNSVGYHAFLLAGGNFLSMSGCLTASGLARYFRGNAGDPGEALEALTEAPQEVIAELQSPELHALTETVIEEECRRTGEPIPEQVLCELPTCEFEALRELVLGEHDRRAGTRDLSPVLA